MFKHKDLEKLGGGLVEATEALSAFPHLILKESPLTHTSQLLNGVDKFTESGKQEQCLMIKCLTKKHKKRGHGTQLIADLLALDKPKSVRKRFTRTPPSHHPHPSTTNKGPIKAKQVFGHETLWSTIPAIHPKTSCLTSVTWLLNHCKSKGGNGANKSLALMSIFLTSFQHSPGLVSA